MGGFEFHMTCPRDVKAEVIIEMQSAEFGHLDIR
jgi:hypothetical protein